MAVQRRPKKGSPQDKGQKPTWVVRYRDPAGKERSRSFATEKAAKKYDAEQAQALARGTWQDPANEKVTVGEVFEGWMHDTPRRQATMDLYDNTLRLQLPPIADHPAVKLTTKDVSNWYVQLTTCREWISKEDTGLAPGTARDQLRRLRSAYRWAIDQGIVIRSPVVIPKLDDDESVRREDIPTIEEVITVINLVREGGAEYTEVKQKGQQPRTYKTQPNPVIADMMTTAMLTGMRINELCGLILDDIDLKAGVIRVTRQLDVRTRKRGPLKTRAARRDIPIAPQLADILRRQRKGKSPTDWVFCGAQGQALRSSRVSVYVARAAKHAGVERVHFHSLRHFFASALITAGRPIHEVSAVMGHSSASMTLDVYTHILDRDGAGMRDAIASAIGCGISAGSRHLKAVP
ncbi:site-specific integrase [Corynebacterium sp. YIM 101645]|uniref:Site-specific integrase n=1 Tax=Corynebacterium lemuris TaxID=1859292 RepID=A0ABT2FX09_9CORY|nr:site-specific integrase [Corynebacterium lemuris]MCS5479772.1 site-specific integrase [Corynebacterium lemuris]